MSPHATYDAPHHAVVELAYRRLGQDVERFLRTSPGGETAYSPHALAVLIAEICGEHTAAVDVGRGPDWSVLDKASAADLELVVHDLELASLSLSAARKAFERVGCAPAAAEIEQIRTDLAAVLSAVTVYRKGCGKS